VEEGIFWESRQGSKQTSKPNSLPVQLIKGPDGLEGGEALKTLSDILATTSRRWSPETD